MHSAAGAKQAKQHPSCAGIISLWGAAGLPSKPFLNTTVQAKPQSHGVQRQHFTSMIAAANKGKHGCHTHSAQTGTVPAEQLNICCFLAIHASLSQVQVQHSVLSVFLQRQCPPSMRVPVTLNPCSPMRPRPPNLRPSPCNTFLCLQVTLAQVATGIKPLKNSRCTAICTVLPSREDGSVHSVLNVSV